MREFFDQPPASALSERHRPRRYDDVIGHNDIKSFLKMQASAAKAGGVGGRSILLYGPHGCGKTSLAEIYGRALHCEFGDGEPCLQSHCDDCSLWDVGEHRNLTRINASGTHATAIAR